MEYLKIKVSSDIKRREIFYEIRIHSHQKMKIIMILATGALITFTADHRTNPDCFSKGYEVLEKIATYHGPEEKGKDQGWVLNDSNVQVGGWYCK